MTPAALADTRLALWSSGLTRSGPGLLLADILRDRPEVRAARQVIEAANADILLLLGVDFDHGLDALSALNAGLSRPYPHLFALAPNSGRPTGLDMDGDGRAHQPRDAQGYGAFPGQGGMAILSHLPVDREAVQDFTGLLWRELPNAILPDVDGNPFPSETAQAVQRLSSVGHWAVPVKTPGGQVILAAWHPTPPLYDGPEDRNGRRNHDETAFWRAFLDGDFGPVTGPVVLMTEAGIDPARDAHRPEALRALLTDPRLRDAGPGEPTTTWGTTGARSSVILTDRTLNVTGSGSVRDPKASRHALIWIDIGF